MGFSIYSKTGMLTHFLAYSNSSMAVIIMIMRLGYLSVAILVNSIPSMKGIEISTKTISGLRSSMMLMASIPLAASPTTSMPSSSQLTRALISFLAVSSSSITMTLNFLFILFYSPLLLSLIINSISVYSPTSLRIRTTSSELL